jgi:hypothetical protein
MEGACDSEAHSGAAEDRAIAALRPVGGVAEIQVVGAISDTVLDQCGVKTDARSVWLHPDVVRKLEAKRPDSVDFILNHIADAVIRPQYCGLDHRDGSRRRIDLVHLVATYGGRPLFVAVKLVLATDAASGSDDIWVSTAYPLPPEFLTEPRYSGRFKPVRD